MLPLLCTSSFLPTMLFPCKPLLLYLLSTPVFYPLLVCCLLHSSLL
uniref:Uncharacterized protein n=1 Tax=Arundo donax TaxID=35708 RepID=A0A0A8Y727_ARUDO